MTTLDLDHLRQEIKRAGLSQRRLAGETKTSQASITMLLTGRRHSLQLYTKLLEYVQAAKATPDATPSTVCPTCLQPGRLETYESVKPDGRYKVTVIVCPSHRRTKHVFGGLKTVSRGRCPVHKTEERLP